MLELFTKVHVTKHVFLYSPQSLKSVSFLANETLLVGRITGPHSAPLRNLTGLFLFIDVLSHNTSIHQSFKRITNHTFPLDYSVVLSERDFTPENVKNFSIISMILQPTLIYESEIKLPENEIDTYNFEMKALSK